MIKKSIKWLLCISFILFFIGLMFKVQNNYNFLIDTKVYNFLWKYLNNPNFLFIIKIITNLGGIAVIALLSVCSLLFIKNKKVSIAIVVNILLCCGLNFIIKNIVARPRPSVTHLVDENGYSFPSGHSMASMAFYGLLIYLIYNYVDNKVLKWVYIILFSCLIGAIGLSRVYLGVHYFTDVLAGFMLSFSLLVVTTTFMNKYILNPSSK